eukprot:s345_g10.t1
MAMTACIAQWSEQHSVMQGRMAELNLMKARAVHRRRCILEAAVRRQREQRRRQQRCRRLFCRSRLLCRRSKLLRARRISRRARHHRRASCP